MSYRGSFIQVKKLEEVLEPSKDGGSLRQFVYYKKGNLMVFVAKRGEVGDKKEEMEGLCEQGVLYRYE